MLTRMSVPDGSYTFGARPTLRIPSAGW